MRTSFRPSTAPFEPTALPLPLAERYELLRRIASGGGSELFAAWDRERAVEVTLQRVNGDVNCDMVMHHLTGRTLDRVLALRGPLRPEAALRIIADLVTAILDHHARGVAHLALVPANVLVDEANHALLLDLEGARECNGCAHEAADVEQLGRLAMHVVLACAPPTERGTLRDVAKHKFPATVANVIARAMAPASERYATVDDFALAFLTALRAPADHSVDVDVDGDEPAPPPPARHVPAASLIRRRTPPISLTPYGATPNATLPADLRIRRGWKQLGWLGAIGCAVVFAGYAATGGWVGSNAIAAALVTPPMAEEPIRPAQIIPTEPAEIVFEVTDDDLAAAAARKPMKSMKRR